MRSKHFLKFVTPLALGVGALITSAAGSLSAQELPSITAQREGQRVVARAVEAAGGRAALQQLRWAEFVLESQLGAGLGQGLRPEAEVTLGAASAVKIRGAGSRTVYRTFNGDSLNFRYVRGGGEDWVHFAPNNTVATVDPLAATALLDRVTVSASVLLEAIDRSETLRSLGTYEHGGVTLDVVTYSDQLGRQRTLYFGQDSGELLRVESLTNHAQFGDITNSVTFTDYAEVEGARVAHKMVLRQGSVTTAETTVRSVRVDTTVDEALFEKPEDATDGPAVTAPATASRTLEVEELADGIFLIPNAANGYNAMFVQYGDDVLVLETPQTPQTSHDVIHAILERLPGSNVRWAVPTHHHFDHSGGLYGYIGHGTTIVTTEGNEQFVRDVAAAPRSIGRVGHGMSGDADVKIETFSGRRSFGDGARRVELIDVGPNPHVDEMLVAYIPSIKTLFVADLYSFQGTVTPANANLLAFADRLEELDLDIETFIPVHGQRATAEQFWESIKLGREEQN